MTTEVPGDLVTPAKLLRTAQKFGPQKCYRYFHKQQNTSRFPDIHA